MLYPIAIYQANGRFVAHAPDLPTLSIIGETMADVVHNARIAMIEYLQTLANQHKPIPKGRDIGEHLDNPEYFGRTWAIISLDSMRFCEEMLVQQLPMSRCMLDEIYHLLGDSVSVQAVQEFIIEAIQEKLEHASSLA